MQGRKLTVGPEPHTGGGHGSLWQLSRGRCVCAAKAPGRAVQRVSRHPYTTRRRSQGQLLHRQSRGCRGPARPPGATVSHCLSFLGVHTGLGSGAIPLGCSLFQFPHCQLCSPGGLISPTSQFPKSGKWRR